MKNQIIKLSKELISFKSTKENPDKLNSILNFAINQLKDQNYKKFSNNKIDSVLFYNSDKLPKKFRIILHAHLDVVPGKPKQYNPYIKGDRLYGRGALDMKSSAAVIILVYKEFAKKVNYPLGLQLVTDEEVGGFNGVNYQVKKGVRANFVITGEPTNFNISNISKGVYWLKLIARGKSAHGACPWKGKNSIYLINNALNNIWGEYKIPQKEVWKTTITVGNILTTNKTLNKVPDHAEAWLDIRYIPKDKDVIKNNLKRLLPEGVTIENLLFEPPHDTPSSSLYIKNLLSIVKKQVGNNSKIIHSHGASDVRHFNKFGCDGIEFGPIGKGIHTDNEWVSVKSLENYYNILKDFLLSNNK